ncbi:hypothetical protein MAHJHV27_50120 [Mycobacterium avium subsp. hominissuis]
MRRLQIDVAEDDPRPFGDEPFGDREPQTLCATCDDRGLTTEQGHLYHASLELAPGRGCPTSEYHISYRICPDAGDPARADGGARPLRRRDPDQTGARRGSVRR